MSLSLPQRYDRDLSRIRNRIDQRHARAEFGADPMHDHEPLADACEFITLADAALQTRLGELTGAAFDRVYSAWEMLQEVRHTLCIDEPPPERAIHVHGLDCGFPATCGFVGLEPEGEAIHLPRPNGVAANGDRTWTADCGEPVVVDSPAREEFVPWQNWEC